MTRIFLFSVVVAIIGLFLWRFVQSLTRDDLVLIAGVLVLGGLGVAHFMKGGGKSDK